MPGIDIDGNVYTLSQSWINTFMNCPEQARLEMRGELPRKESDATAIGTSLHAAVEHALGTGDTEINNLYQVAAEKLTELMALPNFQFVQIKTPETAYATLERTVTSWAEQVYPQLPTVLHVEYPFDVALVETPTATVRLKGSIDCIDEFGDIWDWKTAARPYEQWQVDRYKIQPTAYSYGLFMSDCGIQIDEPVTFHYAVMMKSKNTAEVYSTTRTSDHWCWLQEQARAIVAMIEADLDVWPMNDQHALCSPTWCTAWSDCKGKFL